MLLAGTGDGVYRVAEPGAGGDAGRAARVLDCGRVVELAARDGIVYAATTDGLYRSPDAGSDWEDLAVPESAVWAVHPTADRVYGGSHPARLFVSNDGRGWDEVEGLRSAPTAERWYCPGDEEHGRVRTIRTVPGRSDRLLVGVEVGGLYVSDDGGETWSDRRDPPDDDLHHVAVVGPEEYHVSCGKLDLRHGYRPGGLFRTTDGGDSWTRLDLGEHSYVRESLVHDGVLYVSGARVTPGEWVGEDGAEAALFEGADDGSSFDAVPYPGGPVEIVLSWAVDGGTVYGGTGTRAYAEGRLLRREPDGWADAGRLPASVFSLAAV